MMMMLWILPSRKMKKITVNKKYFSGKCIRYNKSISGWIRMKRLIGFIAFWIAVGMLLMLFLAHHYLIALIIIALLLLIGYNCYL